jgi:hypothetical protein
LAGAATPGEAVAVPRGRSLPARVRLSDAGSRSIPESFLGLSVEVSELSTYARAGAAVDRVLGLLRPLPASSIPLRVGGSSADRAYWQVPALAAPRWVVGLDDAWVGELAALAARDRLRVTLGLNLAVHSPAMAVSLASAVAHALGPAGLAGLAIGNEPDLFAYDPGLQRERIASTLQSTPQRWTRRYSPSGYRGDYIAYARALAGALPGVALLGPETTSAGRRWLAALGGLGRLGPRVLTVHRYRLSSCWARDSPSYPRIPTLLDESATAGLAHRLRSAVRFARRAGRSLVVSEINSMSCGGTAGVADAFATALWAPDVLFELAGAGVGGVNWHMRPQKLNAPFEVMGGAIRPLPELYGLAVFVQMLGTDARLLHTRISAARGLHVKVWAVRSRERDTVLLINKGVRAAGVSIAGFPARGRARLQRLLAPSVRSRDHVTFGGRWIGPDGGWHGRVVTTALARGRGSYHVRVPRYSAALLSFTR